MCLRRDRVRRVVSAPCNYRSCLVRSALTRHGLPASRFFFLCSGLRQSRISGTRFSFVLFWVRWVDRTVTVHASLDSSVRQRMWVTFERKAFYWDYLWLVVYV